MVGLSHSAQVIKRFIMHSKKTAFIVEHDFIMAAYLADRVVVYDGQPSREATAHAPQSLLTGGWCCRICFHTEYVAKISPACKVRQDL